MATFPYRSEGKKMEFKMYNSCKGSVLAQVVFSLRADTLPPPEFSGRGKGVCTQASNVQIQVKI